MMRAIREKRHRLPAHFYVGPCSVAFTVCVRDRICVFIDHETVDPLRQILYEAARHYGCEIYMYAFMPDHLHVIISTDNEEGDPLSAIKRFKQRSGRWFAQHRKGIRWQKDYYDRIVRSPRELKGHVYYVLNNPVRGGLVESWRQYPFVGSTIHDVSKWEDIP
jgi:putative transposase